MRRYPRRECNRCTHMTDIEEDSLGRDVIYCELDECYPDVPENPDDDMEAEG